MDMENLKGDVQKKFTEIRNALHMREKLLLRQADVILQQAQQQLGRGVTPSMSSNDMRDVKFLVEDELELLTAIRNFGRFQLDNINLTLQDVYLKNEDYITPVNDHETMYKCLQNLPQNKTSSDKELLCEDQEQPETIVVDFSRNKSLIEHNAKYMNESIINITLQEAKELIKKAQLIPDTTIPLNLEELDDELESSIVEAVSNLSYNSTATNSSGREPSIEVKNAKSTKKTSNAFKPKITINNCNGTINLRNISNLTINCAAEDSISAQIPCRMQEEEERQIIESDNELSTRLSTGHNQSQNKVKSNRSSKQETTDTSDQSNTEIEVAVKNSTTSMTDTDSPTTSTTTNTTASSSNYSSNSSSRSQSKKVKNNNLGNSEKRAQNNTSKSTQERTATSVAYPYGIVDYDDDCDSIEPNAVNSDFYNRLLNEIKRSLRIKRTTEHSGKQNKQFEDNNVDIAKNETGGNSEIENPARDSNSNTRSSSYTYATTVGSQPGAGRRLVLKNFENLRIVLEANSSDEESFHPVQIEQWLAEIISETDLEPMQNTDILEHSKIHNENSEAENSK